MNTNILLATDSYKASHYKQYPAGAEYVTSYIEARGSDDTDFDFVVTLGIQAYIREYLSVPFTRADLEEAKEVFEAHGEPFNYKGFEYILTRYNGMMPVEIKALPEGTIAPLSVPLVQITNTDPNVPWLTSFLETSLLRAIWYPSTVATNSMVIRRALKAYAAKSATDESVDFKLHDFGARGVSSSESAMIGGFAHLATGALGTDTVEALRFARKYYGAPMAGFSIPASEHSTITTWGEGNGEVDAYRNMINQFGGKGNMFACVIDSYNPDVAIDSLWAGELREEVVNNGGTIILRPDSGNPLTEPVRIVQKVMDNFGYTRNAKGYKVLPDFIRVIQGDGITKTSILKIIENLDAAKISLDNIAFGMGGGMLQQVNRDTLKFAMKANEIVIDGERRDVYKRPMTDTGKASKAGAQAVFNHEVEGLIPIREDLTTSDENELKLVYASGFVSPKWMTTLEEIRERANA